MFDITVIFIHHNLTKVVEQNLRSFTIHNRNINIIPLVVNPKQSGLPGSISILDNPHFGPMWAEVTDNGTNKRMSWLNSSDMALYAAATTTGLPPTRRWLLAEWDTYCSIPLPKLYGKSFNDDIVVSKFFTPKKNPTWMWFNKVDKTLIPPTLLPSLSGVLPVTGILMSNDTFRIIGQQAMKYPLLWGKNTISELRLGTIVKSAGLNPTESLSLRSTMVCCGDITKSIKRPSLYHPVKSII